MTSFRVPIARAVRALCNAAQGALRAALRVAPVVLAAVTLACVSRFVDAGDDIPTDRNGQIVANYHFRIEQGRSLPVCTAFLERVNSASYEAPPYCGIPEKTEVAGFEPLIRRYLPSQELMALVPKIVVYMRDQIKWTPEIGRASRYEEQLEVVNRWASNGLISAWRYAQPISLDNDRRDDNVLIWQEPGCGQVEAGPEHLIERSRTLAFVLSPTNQAIDNSKTVAAFGDPNGAYTPAPDGYMRMGHSGFHTIGTHMGIFKFRGDYYIDTFLDSQAVLDLHSKRIARSTLALANTLIVLLRRGGITKQICQYRMTQRPPETTQPLEPREF